MVSDLRDIVGGLFAVTNFTEDLSLSGTETTAANIAATLATLINELQKMGIIQATVAT